MATVKKTIGRLPVYKGDWVAGTYSMLNQVSYLGSTFQSKIDNNTSQPATLVDNVLQVNSNWSVISNGTAAYLADNRITSVEGKTVQLEQDVNVLRGDVQGVKLPFNGIVSTCKSAILNVDISLRELPNSGDGYKIYLSDNYYQYPNDVSMLIDVLNEAGVLAVYMGIGAYINGVWSRTKVVRLVVQNIKHIGLSSCGIISINGYVHNLEIAGLTVKDMTTFCVQSRSFNTPNAIYYNIRTFNTGINAQQFDDLYNQGRCDEVVFGDGYKKQYYEFNPIFKNIENALGSEGTAVAITNGFKYSYIKKGTSYQYPRIVHQLLANYAPIGSYINIEFDYNVVYGNPILSYIETTGLMSWDDYDKYGQPLTGSGKVKLRSKSISNKQEDALRLCFGAPDQPFEIDVTNVKIYFDSVVNEYLPKYLTKTKWIDSGVNKQDIVLTSPTFSYVKPYKQYSFGSGAPATPPGAAFVEYSDTTTGNIWKSGTKPNTRQFAVTDWKQINN